MTDGDFTADAIAEAATRILSLWKGGFVLGLDKPKGELNLKFRPAEIREYLEMSRGDPAESLATALVAEGGLDNNKIAKPSHLVFYRGTAVISVHNVGYYKTRRQRTRCGPRLNGPWKYDVICPHPSLGRGL